jgi:thioredoxin reductase (NADPH)
MSDPAELQKKNWDVIIVGGGPAAVSASIYIARMNLSVVMIGTEYGGAIARTYLIENYPGFPGVSGYELMEAFQKHYEAFNIPYVYETVTNVEKKGERDFRVTTSDGLVWRGCAVIIASGAAHRKLNIPGEDEFYGRGVSYCATCDGPFFRDKEIAVVGGSDSAAVEALFLAQFAKKVYIIYRREKIRAEPINTKRCETNERIQIIPNTTITSINGSDKVESVTFNNGTIFPVAGVFIAIGEIPRTDMVKNFGLELNQKGEIVVDANCQTKIPGLFAAGDVTNIREKQVITAAAQGVIASYSVREYFNSIACEIPD